MGCKCVCKFRSQKTGVRRVGVGVGCLVFKCVCRLGRVVWDWSTFAALPDCNPAILCPDMSLSYAQLPGHIPQEWLSDACCSCRFPTPTLAGTFVVPRAYSRLGYKMICRWKSAPIYPCLGYDLLGYPFTYSRYAIYSGKGLLKRAHPLLIRVFAGHALDATAKGLDKDLLSALRQGIKISSEAAVDGAMQSTISLTAGVWGRAEVSALFADVNDRAVLSLLSRSRYGGGLKLSDRVWKTSRHARVSIQRIIEDGVARGRSARDTAKLLEKYLQPNVWTALKAETRRNLGTPRDVSMEAMRLAVTETNNAFHEGAIAGYHMMPGYTGSYWRLSGNHPLHDICDDYAAHNGNGFWPKGGEPPKPHPNCRCHLEPATEPREAFTARLNNWAADPASEPDIEEWYNDGPRQFLKRPGLGVMVTPGIDLARRSITSSIYEAHGWTPTANKAVREVSDDIRQRTVDAGVEFAAMVDAETGDKIGGIVRGVKGSADVSGHISLMRDGQKHILLHTHPRSTAFSYVDVGLLARDDLAKKLQTMYVVGRDGTRYLISPKPGSKVASREAVKRAFGAEEGIRWPAWHAKVRAGKISKELAEKECTHEVWTNIADDLGLIYHRIEGE